MNNEFWKMKIGECEGSLVIYTSATKERLEKIRADLKLPENIKVEICTDVACHVQIKENSNKWN